MSSIDSICPQPSWAQLLNEFSSDNSQIKALVGRLENDTDPAQYSKDLAAIQKLEQDEHTVYSELYQEASSRTNPQQARQDLSQLVKDYSAQATNINEINHWHSMGSAGAAEFQAACAHGKAICDFSISPDINHLRQD
ncbi:MAG: hypothetical protein K1X28_00970 [Parachlamydiales bacterium]|nr:hypothetical protein [Parachlamydiales bacterium]